MIIESLSLPDVKLVKPRIFSDARGFFLQTYHYEQYRAAGLDVRFVQDNWSRSAKGVLRGLHYQLKHPQAKLISVIRGEVFDVAVDIRKGSPTFRKWAGTVLSEENRHQMFIPAGFAHGFCVLSREADLVYKCSDFYTYGDEYSLRWDDPDLSISWPDMIDPIISEKDLCAPRLKNVPAENLPDLKPNT